MDHAAAKEAHALVDEYLPQLKPLLDSLRSRKNRAYQKAVNDLARSARRIAKIKERDPELFRIELDLLQSKTQADLLAAKLKLRESSVDRADLKSVSKHLIDARITRLKYQSTLLEKRLATTKRQLDSTNKQIDAVETSKSESVNTLYQQFLRRAGRKEREGS